MGYGISPDITQEMMQQAIIQQAMQSNQAMVPLPSQPVRLPAQPAQPPSDQNLPSESEINAWTQAAMNYMGPQYAGQYAGNIMSAAQNGGYTPPTQPTPPTANPSFGGSPQSIEQQLATLVQQRENLRGPAGLFRGVESQERAISSQIAALNAQIAQTTQQPAQQVSIQNSRAPSGTQNLASPGVQNFTGAPANPLSAFGGKPQSMNELAQILSNNQQVSPQSMFGSTPINSRYQGYLGGMK